MKHLLFLSLLCIGFNAMSQTLDNISFTPEIESIISSSRSLNQDKQHQAALELLLQTENMCKREFGKNSIQFASVCLLIGDAYIAIVDFNEAKSYYLKAQKSLKKVVGEDDLDYMVSLDHMAELYQLQEEFEEIEPLYLKCKEIEELNFSKAHPAYIERLNKLALLYSRMIQYEDAEKYLEESRTIINTLLGGDNPEYAKTLQNLAMLKVDMGKYDEAEQLYFEAKSILENTQGSFHEDYGILLCRIGKLFSAMGKYEDAFDNYSEGFFIIDETIGWHNATAVSLLIESGHLRLNMLEYEGAKSDYIESKSIIEQLLGKENMLYAELLNSLGILNVSLGQYEQAEINLVESKAIQDRLKQGKHPSKSATLTSLGLLYSNIGQFEKAEKNFESSIEMLRPKKMLAWGWKKNPKYANILNHLGHLYTRMGHFTKAKKNLEESKSIIDNVNGKETPDYANILSNLGHLYIKMEKYNKAKNNLEKSISISENLFGGHNFIIANALNNLGLLHYDLREYDKAERYFQRSKNIIEGVLGQEHTKYSLALKNLGTLYYSMGHKRDAAYYFAESSKLDMKIISKAQRHLSEREMSQFIRTFESNQNIVFSFMQEYPNAPAIIPTCYNNILFHKGYLLNAVNQMKRLTRTSKDPDNKYEKLKSYSRQLSKEYTKPVDQRDLMAIAELQEKANSLEKEIVNSIAGLGEAMKLISWEEVQAGLEEGEAAIEFMNYDFINKDGQGTDSTIYAAFVIRKGIAQPLFIKLFEGRDMEVLIRKPIDSLYKYETLERGATRVEAPSKSLYELIWKPLIDPLTDINTIYFSPSGLLHRINLGAIPESRKTTMLHKYLLVQVNSTRQLALSYENQVAEDDAFLLGGTQFNLDSSFLQNAGVAVTSELDSISDNRGSFSLDQGQVNELSIRSIDNTLVRAPLKPLVSTEVEVDSIAHILSELNYDAQTRSGLQAREEEIRKATNAPVSPRIVHLATHGYFFPDPKKRGPPINSMSNREPAFKTSDHPLIRSGLILAGGNHVWVGNPPVPGIEDGILTAYEVSQMNMSNTQLVVLSACETGLGEIQGNEGVFGLQRSFKIAGAKYLIMSLWKVPDEATMMFMLNFYKNWVVDKMDIPVAFRTTQKWMQDERFTPNEWAAFVLVE